MPEKQTKILNVRVDLLSKEEVLRKVDNLLSGPEEPKETQLLCTTNPEFILSAQKDPEFRELINKSFLSVPDGVGVLYANYLFGDYRGYFGERIDGVTLVYDLANLAEKNRYSVFLLGGWPKDYWGRPLKKPNFDLAHLTGKKLKQKYPDLKLIGATSIFSYKKKDDVKTINYIKERMKAKNVDKIDILVVCYGHKNQEKWIKRNGKKIPAVLGIGAGGSFDYISGTKPWAPRIIRKMHIEWLYRLITQPWRVKRIFMSFLVFPLLVFIHEIHSLYTRDHDKWR